MGHTQESDSSSQFDAFLSQFFKANNCTGEVLDERDENVKDQWVDIGPRARINGRCVTHLRVLIDKERPKGKGCFSCVYSVKSLVGKDEDGEWFTVTDPKIVLKMINIEKCSQGTPAEKKRKDQEQIVRIKKEAEKTKGDHFEYLSEVPVLETKDQIQAHFPMEEYFGVDLQEILSILPLLNLTTLDRLLVAYKISKDLQDSLHKDNCKHRNLHPGNILVNISGEKGRCQSRVIDLATADTADSSLVGYKVDVRYQTKAVRKGGIYTKAEDVYALGRCFKKLFRLELKSITTQSTPVEFSFMTIRSTAYRDYINFKRLEKLLNLMVDEKSAERRPGSEELCHLFSDLYHTIFYQELENQRDQLELVRCGHSTQKKEREALLQEINEILSQKNKNNFVDDDIQIQKIEELQRKIFIFKRDYWSNNHELFRKGEKMLRELPIMTIRSFEKIIRNINDTIRKIGERISEKLQQLNENLNQRLTVKRNPGYEFISL